VFILACFLKEVPLRGREATTEQAAPETPELVG